MYGCLILIPERQNAIDRALPREVALLKMKEQTGNVYENKRSTWKTRTIPKRLNTRREREDDEVGRVQEHKEVRQWKADG